MFMKCQIVRAALITAGLSAVVMAASVPASAQITKAGAGYLFRMKYTKGAKLAYTMTSDTPNSLGPGQPKHVIGPFSLTVVELAGGVATIRIQSGPFIIDGKNTNQTNSADVQMDSQGKMIKAQAGAKQFGVVLPDKPIKVGESFDSVSSTQLGPQTVTVKSHCTFTGIKTIRGRQAAEIKVAVNGSGPVATTGKGTQHIDMADGQLLDAILVQQATVPVKDKPVTVVNTITITRK